VQNHAVTFEITKTTAMVPRMKTIRTLPERWLWLGVFAIAVAGLYALVPVCGWRQPLRHSHSVAATTTSAPIRC
jgi:hypothetical protein